MARSAQVARSFFTDVADEVDGAVGLNAGFLERARDGENNRESAIVVTDYADNVRRIESIAHQLDGSGGSTFATIVLRNGNAPDVAQDSGQLLTQRARCGVGAAGLSPPLAARKTRNANRPNELRGSQELALQGATIRL